VSTKVHERYFASETPAHEEACSEQPLETAKTDDTYRRALDLNIRAFEAQPVEWKEKLRGQFVLFHQGKFVMPSQVLIMLPEQQLNNSGVIVI